MHPSARSNGLLTVRACSRSADSRRRRSPRFRGLTVLAGFLGGFLSTTTSLIGVPPALLLARRRLAQSSFFADMAAYQLAAAALGLGVLAWRGHFDTRAGRA